MLSDAQSFGDDDDYHPEFTVCDGVCVDCMSVSGVTEYTQSMLCGVAALKILICITNALNSKNKKKTILHCFSVGYCVRYSDTTILTRLKNF